MRKAVFLDRDGTWSEEVGYMRDLSMYSVFPWTGPAIRRLNEGGLPVVLITNQSAVGRGLFGPELVDRVHEALAEEIGREGARLDGIYYCTHHPDDGCGCRKPKPGLLLEAGQDMELDLAASFMVGDRYTDIQSGRAAGMRTVLVLTGAGREELARHGEADVQPDHVVRTLEDAADLILGELVPDPIAGHTHDD